MRASKAITDRWGEQDGEFRKTVEEGSMGWDRPEVCLGVLLTSPGRGKGMAGDKDERKIGTHCESLEIGLQQESKPMKKGISHYSSRFPGKRLILFLLL